MTALPIIAKLVHYPVKGLNGLAKTQAVLTVGEGMPLDRLYAIENGSHRFDAQNPKWFPKTHFLQLMDIIAIALALGVFAVLALLIEGIEPV